MCKVLGVSSSGFYDWFERPASQREHQNAQLLQAIKNSHAASDATYGSPRVVRDLIDAGLPCSENRVARLMKAAGIKARHKRRRAPGHVAEAVHANNVVANSQNPGGLLPHIFLLEKVLIRLG